MSGMARAAVVVRRLLDGIIGTLLAVIVVITLAQVVARYVLGSSLVWSEELNRLLHIWLVMLAAAKAAHLRIGLLEDRLPPRAKLGLDLSLAAIGILLLALMIQGGLVLADLTRFDMFTGLPVSMRWMFVALVVGAGLWAARIVLDAATAFRHR